MSDHHEEYTKQEVAIFIVELIKEHNKIANLLQFIVDKGLEKNIFTEDDLENFLNDTDLFNEKSLLLSPEKLITILEEELAD